MLGDVEAFALDFFLHAQADRHLDQTEHDQAADTGMCIELMLNAVNLSFIAFAHEHKQVAGHLFTFFVMVVAAAEAAVGLAIILTVFRNRSTLNIDEIESLKN